MASFLLLNQSLYLKICVCNVFAHSPSLSTPKVVTNQLLINYLTEEAAVGTAVRPNMTIVHILQRNFRAPNLEEMTESDKKDSG